MAQNEVAPERDIRRDERLPVDPSLADAIPLERGRRRVAGFRRAQRVSSHAAHTESMLFDTILDDLLAGTDRASVNLGVDVVIEKREAYNIPVARVDEQRTDNKTKLVVSTNPDEYEWLTANLGLTEWREAEGSAGVALGRYYRLTNLTRHILETRGEVDFANEAFQSLPDVCDGEYLIRGCTDQEQYDISTRRLAGAHALRALSLEQDEEHEFRDYLEASLEKRVGYITNLLVFNRAFGGELPPDANDQDLPHWKGVCLPLLEPEIAPTKLEELWAINGKAAL